MAEKNGKACDRLLYTTCTIELNWTGNIKQNEAFTIFMSQKIKCVFKNSVCDERLRIMRRIICVTKRPMAAGVIMAPAFQPSDLTMREPANIITVADMPTIAL